MSNSKTSLLYSENFILLVVVLAMLSNIEHAASVYHALSHSIFQNIVANWVYAAIVVLIIDLAVLVLVINGRHITAGCYALGMFFINVVYYGGMNELQVVDLATGNQVNRVISIVIYSVMFTYSIYTFSRMYLERINRSQQKDENEQRVSDLRVQVVQMVSKHQEEISSLTAEWEQALRKKDVEIVKLDTALLHWEKKYKQLHHQSEVAISQAAFDQQQAVGEISRLEIELGKAEAQLNVQLAKLTCPDCNYVAKDAYGLSGHKKSCIRRKQLAVSN